jgi:hypothetical protein
MTDPKLLRDARDALERVARMSVSNPNRHDLEDKNSYEQGLHDAYSFTANIAQETLNRLDAELAKVAEPVVLDLSGAVVSVNIGPYLRREQTLAVIRAQLPGVEIKC